MNLVGAWPEKKKHEGHPTTSQYRTQAVLLLLPAPTTQQRWSTRPEMKISRTSELLLHKKLSAPERQRQETAAAFSASALARSPRNWFPPDENGLERQKTAFVWRTQTSFYTCCIPVFRTKRCSVAEARSLPKGTKTKVFEISLASR